MVVFCMRPNPKPIIPFRLLKGQCPVLPSDTNRPQIFSDTPEMQGRMQGVILQKRVILVGQLPHLFWQGIVAVPKVRRGKMVHKGQSATNFQGLAQSGLPLLPDPLPQYRKTPCLDILRDLPLPRLCPVLLDPFKQSHQFPRGKFSNR